MVDPTAAMLHALNSLNVEDVSTFEYLLIQELVEGLPDAVSDDVDDGEEAYHLMARMQAALMKSADRELAPIEEPVVTEEIATYRAALVAGAHSFGERGPEGFKMLVAMLIPAVQQEFEDGEDFDAKLQGVFTWMLMGLVAGFGATTPPMWAWAAIRQVLALWSEILVPD